MSDLKKILEAEKDSGLKIKPSKCELHFIGTKIDPQIVQSFNKLAPGIRTISDDNLTLSSKGL